MVHKTSTAAAGTTQQHLSTAENAYIFHPCKLQGTITMPPSKSYLHRYLLAAALTKEQIELHNVSVLADDIKVSLAILADLGMDYHYDTSEQVLIVFPTNQPIKSNVAINMQESGTSLRLFLPTLIQHFQQLHITGENKLPMRPLAPYIQALNHVTFVKKTANNLPMQIFGYISAKDYVFREPMSSQFVSGLLFALPLLEEPSTITLTSEPLSLPYIQMTLEVLALFNIQIEHNNTYTHFTIPGSQCYKAPNQAIAVEQDYSARAFWEVARAIKHPHIHILPAATRSLQGDAKILDIIAKKQTVIDLAPTPDLGPILALYLSQTTGGILQNVDVLIHKESNRLAAIIAFFKQAGIPYKYKNNTLEIGTQEITPGSYDTHYDHRMTMMLIIAASVATGSMKLAEVASIHKSYPDFLNDYQYLGGVMYE